MSRQIPLQPLIEAKKMPSLPATNLRSAFTISESQVRAVLRDKLGYQRFTPGPWHWDSGYLMPEVPNPNGSAVHTILDPEGLTYGYAMSDWHATRAESEGNRRLIAASPDLLDALLIAEEFMSGFEDDDVQIGMGIKLAIIRAAITKAKGRH